MEDRNEPEIQKRFQKWNGLISDLLSSDFIAELNKAIEDTINAPRYDDMMLAEWYNIPITDEIQMDLLRDEVLIWAVSGENIHWASSISSSIKQAYKNKDYKRIEILRRTLQAFVTRCRMFKHGFGEPPVITKIWKEMIERVEADYMVAEGKMTRARADEVLKKIGINP